jgi:hypothetical protein
MKEPSMFHPEVPRLTEQEIHLFKSNPELQDKIETAFWKMMDFYGLEYDMEQVNLRWQQPGKHRNPDWWLKHFNHNCLRITRILKSTRYLGADD